MNISELLGKTLTKIEVSDDKKQIQFFTSDATYLMYHRQSCCESVRLEDVCGSFKDLVGNPLLVAEENSSKDFKFRKKKKGVLKPHETWTFYKLDTIKGGVTLRWYGSSNGNYSEKVDFAKCKKDGTPIDNVYDRDYDD